MSRKTKALSICGSCLAILVLFLSFGHRLQDAKSRGLRELGRRALWIRMRVGAGSTDDLLDSVSAAITRSADGAERRKAFAQLTELLDHLTPSERKEFSAGIRAMFASAPSDVHAIILVIEWEDEFSDEFFVSALWADSQHARYVASNAVFSRKEHISAEQIARALEKCLRSGTERNDLSMIVDALEAALVLRARRFCVRQEETLQRLAKHHDEAVRTAARRCLRIAATQKAHESEFTPQAQGDVPREKRGKSGEKRDVYHLPGP